MAAIFDNTGDVLAVTGVELGNTLGSVSFWFKPTWAQTDATVHSLMFLFFDASNQFHFYKYSDNNLYIGFFTAGADHRVTVLNAAYTLNQNAWNHFAITMNDTANLSELWLNGTKIGTKGTLAVFSTAVTPLAVGNETVPAVDARGKMAKVGIYNAILSDAQIAALNSGGSVPTGLTNYWPLQSDGVATVGGLNFTNTNVTFDSDGPPVISSQRGLGLRMGLGL